MSDQPNHRSTEAPPVIRAAEPAPQRPPGERDEHPLRPACLSWSIAFGYFPFVPAGRSGKPPPE